MPSSRTMAITARYTTEPSTTEISQFLKLRVPKSTSPIMTDAKPMTKETLQAICDAVEIPVVAIGGINRYNLLNLAGSGVDGVALVSAVFSAEDIEVTCRGLRVLSEKMVNT